MVAPAGSRNWTDRRALVFGGKETGRKAHEHDDQDGADGRVDGQEQPFAVDHPADAADIPGDQPLEAGVEFHAAAVDRMRQARGAAADPALLDRPWPRLSRLAAIAGLRSGR